jgi:hypothetical protein
MARALATEANGLCNLIPKRNLASTSGQAQEARHPTASTTTARAKHPRPAAFQEVLVVTSLLRERPNPGRQRGPSHPSANTATSDNRGVIGSDAEHRNLTNIHQKLLIASVGLHTAAPEHILDTMGASTGFGIDIRMVVSEPDSRGFGSSIDGVLLGGVGLDPGKGVSPTLRSLKDKIPQVRVLVASTIQGMLTFVKGVHHSFTV